MKRSDYTENALEEMMMHVVFPYIALSPISGLMPKGPPNKRKPKKGNLSMLPSAQIVSKKVDFLPYPW